MNLVVAIAERSILLFGGLLFLSQVLCYEGGFWLGRRRIFRGQKAESVGVLVGAMLGLLAFVLALTLSFATTRFDERQSGGLAEANAIGTAWLRANAVGGADAEAIATLIEQYAKLRAEFVRLDQSSKTLGQLNQRTGAMQTEIWMHLKAIVRAKPDVISNSLMVSLNDMFDASTVERLNFHLRLPPQIFWLLIGLTLMSMGCLGYQLGIRQGAPRPLAISLMLVWSLVLLVILDLASARVGQIRTTTAAYVWTLEAFGAGAQPSAQQQDGR